VIDDKYTVPRDSQDCLSTFLRLVGPSVYSIQLCLIWLSVWWECLNVVFNSLNHIQPPIWEIQDFCQHQFCKFNCPIWQIQLPNLADSTVHTSGRIQLPMQPFNCLVCYMLAWKLRCSVECSNGWLGFSWMLWWLGVRVSWIIEWHASICVPYNGVYWWGQSKPKPQPQPRGSQSYSTSLVN